MRHRHDEFSKCERVKQPLSQQAQRSQQQQENYVRGGLSSGAAVRLTKDWVAHSGKSVTLGITKVPVRGLTKPTHRQAQKAHVVQPEQAEAGAPACASVPTDPAIDTESAINSVFWWCECSKVTPEAIESHAHTGTAASADSAKNKKRTRAISRMKDVRKCNSIVFPGITGDQTGCFDMSIFK
jgi:hypothetical protein